MQGLKSRFFETLSYAKKNSKNIRRNAIMVGSFAVIQHLGDDPENLGFITIIAALAVPSALAGWWYYNDSQKPIMKDKE